jgi:hypothetical protein
MCVEVVSNEGLEEAYLVKGVTKLEDENDELLMIISKDELTFNGMIIR